MGLRITTWNVNGIRNPFAYEPWREKRTFQVSSVYFIFRSKAMFDTLEADILVMQETKIQRKDLRDDMVLVPGWDVFFSLPRHKKGYSGVAVYTRNAKCCPLRAEEGITGVLTPPQSGTAYRDLPQDQQIGGYPRLDQFSSPIDELTLDSEGRCLLLEFPAFVLIGVYSPAQRDETRTEFRHAFLDALDARIRNLVATGKQVVLTGDLNVIRSELDVAGLKERLRKEDMTMEDFFSVPGRRLFNHLIFDGTIYGERDEGREQPILHDICREFHPRRQGMYTCWETKKNARPGNFGSRIDYVLCSDGIRHCFVDSNIQEGLLGSDHCPVYATLGEQVGLQGSEVSALDALNPPDMVRDGKRLRDWSAKDLLPLSAKLIPEFDRRQSIKDMFFKKESSTKPVDLSPTPQASEAPSDLEKSLSAEIMKKRPADGLSTANRPQKKGKISLTKEPSEKGANGASQGSLITGFFKPKTSQPIPSLESSTIPLPSKEDSPVSLRGMSSDVGISESPSDKVGIAGALRQDGAALDTAPGPAPSQEDTAEYKFIDPFEAKESWSKLLGGRTVPRCEGHNERCISLLTKRPGINCGRSFYICPRPLGPSGEKEMGTAFRCKTFIWSSDWNG